MKDCLVVGTGFSGAVAARKLADEGGLHVLMLEKRPTVGGNMYDYLDSAGVLVHRYGPHIFHTSSETAFRAVEKYSRWFPYEHRVKGKIAGSLVPIPFNFESLETLFPSGQAEQIKAKLLAAFPERSRVSVLELLESGDAVISDFGQYVFDNVFKNYTAKQWGTPAENVDKGTINRVPVVLGYDDRYFGDTIQCMPADGFTKLFEKLLDTPRIEIRLGCNAAECLRPDEASGKLLFNGQPFEGPVLYTGAVDELLSYRYGPLPYRSVDMRLETYPQDSFQPAAVVNYPNEEAFTRITEFKRLTGQNRPGVTTVMKEYPLPYDPSASKGNIPFYTVASEENNAHWRQYAQDLKQYSNLFLCGRLAEYKYYNMDKAIDRSLAAADEILMRTR